MKDLINLTEIIASKLNFLTENYTLFSNPIGSYILNRKEKEIIKQQKHGRTSWTRRSKRYTK